MRLNSLVPALLLAVVALPVRAEKPRLGVVVVVDQLSMAQLDRAEDLLSEDGFRRLLREGAVSRDARYLGAPTVTAHGHATLATGAYGAHHGIVGNQWWARGKGVVAVCHDPRFRLLTRETTEKDGTSPADLRAPTVGDSLRGFHPGAKVVSLALKDRAAILLGGARPTAAIWHDALSDRWTTSNYYADSIPAWVPGERTSAGLTTWSRFETPRLCALLPKEGRPTEPAECARRLYERRAGLDDDPVEQGGAGFSPTFPHALPPEGDGKRGRSFRTTPMADEALFALATRAIEAEQLGADEVPDLLLISASAFDSIGHDFGPESQESLDALLRVDAALGRFMRALDAKVGRGRWVLALSADHGVTPTAERAKREGQPAGRFEAPAVIAAAEKALDDTLGPRDWLGPYLTIGFSFREVSFTEAERARAEAIVVDAVRRQEGIAEVFPRSLFRTFLALRGAAEIYGRSYFDGRSPDFIVHPRPLWTWEDVASHSTAYLADRRVPFVLYRGSRAAQRIDGIVDVAALTPTLALVLGAPPPAAAEAGILTAVVDGLR